MANFVSMSLKQLRNINPTQSAPDEALAIEINSKSPNVTIKNEAAKQTKGLPNYNLDIEINCNISKIIGKNGEIIKHLQDLTKCKIILKKLDNTLISVNISGEEALALKAEDYIRFRFHNVERTQVYPCSTGFLIGPQGSNSNRVRLVSSNKVQLHYEGEFKTTTVTFLGPLHDIKIAQKEIDLIINENNDRNDHRKNIRIEKREEKYEKNKKDIIHKKKPEARSNKVKNLLNKDNY